MSFRKAFPKKPGRVKTRYGLDSRRIIPGRDVILIEKFPHFPEVFGGVLFGLYSRGVLVATRHGKTRFWTLRRVARTSLRKPEYFGFPKYLVDREWKDERTS